MQLNLGKQVLYFYYAILLRRMCKRKSCYMRPFIFQRRNFLYRFRVAAVIVLFGNFWPSFIKKVFASSSHDQVYPGQKALSELLKGNEEFVKLLNMNKDTSTIKKEFCDHFIQQGIVDRKKEFNDYKNVQRPKAIVIGCADSRVPPEIVFDQGLGSLFVVRLAGNFVDGAGHPILGSIEYAVEHLGVRLIIILGHQKCGAIKAAVEALLSPFNGSSGKTSPVKSAKPLDDSEPLAELVETIRKNMNQKFFEGTISELSQKPDEAANIYDRLVDVSIANNVKAGVRYLENWKKFESVLKASGNNQLVIKGATYSIDTGKIEFI